MARFAGPAYRSAMINVIQLSPPPEPTDDKALYVWASVVQPAWGSLAAALARPTVGVKFSNADWQTAIDGAIADARRADIPNVCGIRDA
jgi:hypothetical protein